MSSKSVLLRQPGWNPDRANPTWDLIYPQLLRVLPTKIGGYLLLNREWLDARIQPALHPTPYVHPTPYTLHPKP